MSWWERESRHQTLNFFLVFSCSSNILVCWVVFLCKGVRKFSSPHIFVASVQLTFFTLSRLANNSPQNESFPPFHLMSVGGKIPFCWFYTCTEDFGTTSFLLSSPLTCDQLTNKHFCLCHSEVNYPPQRLYIFLFLLSPLSLFLSLSSLEMSLSFSS